jgi:hypothetical protein
LPAAVGDAAFAGAGLLCARAIVPMPSAVTAAPANQNAFTSLSIDERPAAEPRAPDRDVSYRGKAVAGATPGQAFPR